MVHAARRWPYRSAATIQDDARHLAGGTPAADGLQLRVSAGLPGHADLAARAGGNGARDSADDVPGDAAHDTAVQSLALSRGDVVIGKGSGHSDGQGDVAGRPRPISRQAAL